MTNGKVALTVMGEQLVGKGIRMGADYIDTSMAKGAETILKRPSTWVNLIAGVGGIYLSTVPTVAPGTRNAALIIGTNVLADALPSVALEVMGGAVGMPGRMAVRRVAPARIIPTARAPVRPVVSAFF